jgi:hypothetical protein
MGYKHIKKVNCSKERKKVVGARVPVDILNAIQDAESDSGQTGFTLSITEIIENALLDTLQELNQATGIDYHELSILKGELYDYVGPADVDTEENLNEVINSLKIMAIAGPKFGNLSANARKSLFMRSIRSCRRFIGTSAYKSSLDIKEFMLTRSDREAELMLRRYKDVE